MDMRSQLKHNRVAVFEKLYEQSFPEVAYLVKKMGGNYEDAKDTFHDAIILLYERVVLKNQLYPKKPKAYLKVIAKNIWLKKLEAKSKFGELKSVDFHDLPIENNGNNKGLNKSLLKHLQFAGQKCIRLLEAFYYHKWSMEEITTQFGYGSIRSATVQKHKCLEKVRMTVKKEELYTQIAQ